MAKYQFCPNEERVPTVDAEDICGVGLGYHRGSVSALRDLFSLFRGKAHLSGKAARGCTPWEP